MNNFLLDNFYYITNILTIFSLLLAAWLVYDSSNVKKDRIVFAKTIGFFLLSIAFIFKQLFIYHTEEFTISSHLLITLGSLFLLTSIKLEKILTIKENPSRQKYNIKLRSMFPLFILTIPFFNGILNFITSILVWKRYRKGLVYEYKYLLIFFIFFTISQLASALMYFESSINVYLNNLASKYGIIWLLVIITQLIATISISAWIIQYLRFRIYALLFFGLTAILVLASTFSAFIYSLFLFTKAESDLLSQLNTNAQTINYSIEQLKNNALTAANLLCLNDVIKNSLSTNDYNKINQSISIFRENTEDIDSIIITNNAGIIIANSDEINKIGQSMNNNLLVNQALTRRESNVTLSLAEDVLASSVIVEAVSPVIDQNNKILGTIRTSFILDNAYADKIKEKTNLDIIIFSNTNRSASTFTEGDEISRLVNAKETNKDVIDTVFKNHAVYTGRTDLINTPYYSAYIPLENLKNEVIGMIFAGRSQQAMLDTATEANINTFIIAILVSIISIIPAKYLADYVYKNYRA
mgnify:CR=1 FL=1